jgi:hypothetical protein
MNGALKESRMNESIRELGYILRAIGVLPNDIFKEPVVPKSHRIEETLVNVNDVKPQPQPYPIQVFGTIHDKITRLSGSSRDRRKQLRRIKKENPDCIIKVTAPSMYKVINGERVHVEDANVPQTIVVIKPKEK